MNRLRECRKNKKLTLKQLSEELAKNNLKISADALGKYERGDREPKLETWIKLADFFHVSVSYLQGISDFSTYAIPAKEMDKIRAKLVGNPSFSDLAEADKMFENSWDAQNLNGFVLLHSAMKKAMPGYPETESAAVNTLSKEQMMDIFDTVSSIYSLAIEALNGNKISKKYYEKVKQLYSECVDESTRGGGKSSSNNKKDDELPF